MLKHVFRARTDSPKVGPTFAQGDAEVWPRRNVNFVQILAVVFPEAHRTDQVISPLG